MGVTAALVGGVALGPGAASAQLPDLPVPVPTVVPELRVQTPQVQVETPRLPVPAPQVRVEVPPVRVQTPAVRVPSPQQPVAAPQVRVPTPRVQVQTPQRPTVTTPRATPPAGSAPARSGSGSAAAAPSADGSGAARPAPAQASGSAPAAARSEAGAPPAPGSSERPAARGRRDATARPRARQAGGPRRERRLRRTVARLAGCLDSIAALPRQVLSLRAGAGSSDPQSRRAVAARLDTNVHRVARAERKGLRQLRRAARAGHCGGAAPDPAAAAAPSPGERGGVMAPPAPATAEREERGEARPAVAGVQGEFRSSAKPDPEKLIPPAGDATEPPIMLLVVAAFAIGFAAMWARDRGWGGPSRVGPRRAR